MATVNPAIPLITGTSNAGTACTAETVYIVPTTAQSVLDFSRMVVRIANQTSAVTVITMNAGTQFSEFGQGGGSTISLGTSGSASGVILIGGTSFESARYLDSSGYFSFSCTGTSTLVSAIMLPYAIYHA